MSIIDAHNMSIELSSNWFNKDCGFNILKKVLGMINLNVHYEWYKGIENK